VAPIAALSMVQAPRYLFVAVEASGPV